MAMASNTADFGPPKRQSTFMASFEVENEDIDLFDDREDDEPSSSVKPIDDVLAVFEKDLEFLRDADSRAMKKRQEAKSRTPQTSHNLQGDAKPMTDDGKTSTYNEIARINNELLTEFTRLVEKRKTEWQKQTWDGRNFLHHLAYQYQSRNRSNIGYALPVITLTIKQVPQLMGKFDNKRRTPLTAAIAEQNRDFCKAVFRVPTARLQPMGDELMSECRRGADDHRDIRDSEITCLHAALTPGDLFNSDTLSRTKVLVSLISIVPIEMFTVKDSQLRTPLHLAVQYENCDMPSQVDIVRLLLERGPKALDSETKLESGRLISVYQFHQLSKSRWEKKEHARRKKEAENQNKSKGHADQQQQQRREFGKAEKTQTRGLVDQQPGENMPPEPTVGSKQVEPRQKSKMQPPPAPSISRSRPDANVSSRRDSMVITTPITGLQQPRLLTKVQGTPSQPGTSPKVMAQSSAAKKSSEAMDENNQEDQNREKMSAAIIQHLKVLCLRTKQPHQATQYLQNLDGKEGPALWFDFGPRRKLSKRAFDKLFNHLRFDSVLQYVAFPQIDLPALETNGATEAQKDPVVLFFKWLRQDTRKVEHIIRVIVDDFEDSSGHISHSDEGIEEALSGFDVEILDWRRPDLCPASLHKIGQSLREVNLYWSGRNVVLRAWSELDGLCKLPRLQTVNIIMTAGLVSDRTEENLLSFEQRLLQSWDLTWSSVQPKPVVLTAWAAHFGQTQSQSAGAQPGALNSSALNEQSVRPHRWMECMKAFSEEFRQTIGKLKPGAWPTPKPVVVALIDDGTDIEHTDLSFQRPFQGESLDQYKQGSGYRVSPWWHSSSGHGTLMARLIAGICPSAVIHIIKLQTFMAKDSSNLQIDERSAIQAIKYATEMGAHIISMSWTVKPSEELRAEFLQAINAAVTNHKGILMFCAASDKGKFSDRTFPHANYNNIFRIGAATATGELLKTVGDQQTLSFTLPGHDVVIDRWYEEVDKDTFEKFDAHSGSSVATALAAGLAALIIECVRLGVIHTNDNPEKQGDSTVAITMDDLSRIRKFETMKEAMRSIGTDMNTQHQYLEVWRLFEAKTALLRDANTLGRMEIIAALARVFLKK